MTTSHHTEDYCLINNEWCVELMMRWWSLVETIRFHYS